MEMPENRLYYPALDGLRAIAILLVFANHYLLMAWGWTGVDLFFVLSGFLITGILLDTQNDKHRARIFYMRRVLRIFPLYYGTLLLIYLLCRGFEWQWLIWPAYAGNLAGAFSFPQHIVKGWPTGPGSTTLYIGHFWSLCVEEQFYLIFPWIVFAVRSRRKLAGICVLAMTGSLAGRLIGHSHGFSDSSLYRQLWFRMDSLCLGALLAILIRTDLKVALFRMTRLLYLPIVIGCAIICVLGSPHLRLLTDTPPAAYTWGLTVIDLAAATVIAAALQPETWLYRWMTWKPLRALGKISYGVYLFHDIPHLYYQAMAARLVTHYAFSVTALVAFIATLLLASASYRWLERPFLKMKRFYVPG